MKRKPSVVRASKVNFLLAAVVMVFTHVGRCQTREGLTGVALHPRLEHIRRRDLADITASLNPKDPVLHSAGKVHEDLSRSARGRTLNFKHGETRNEAFSITRRETLRASRDKSPNNAPKLTDNFVLGEADETRFRSLRSVKSDERDFTFFQTNIPTRTKRHEFARDKLSHNNRETSVENARRTLMLPFDQENIPVTQNNEGASEKNWKRVSREHDHSKKHRCRHQRRKKRRKRRHRHEYQERNQRKNNSEKIPDESNIRQAWPIASRRSESFLIKSNSPSYVITSASNLQKDWCRTLPLRQKVTERGCQPRTVMNRFCYGQCNSFFIPRTVSVAFQSCAFCKPHRSAWTSVTLHCPGLVPPVRRKKILRVETCRCKSEILR